MTGVKDPVDVTHRYLVHYGEIALKGRNRPDFEQQLVDNIKSQQPVTRVRRLPGRMVAESDQPVDLSAVFGIAWWAEVDKVEASVDSIRRRALAMTAERIGAAQTFAVRVTRADKSFPLRSQELEELVGGDIDEQYPIPVDLGQPEFCLQIEITEGSAYLFTERHEGKRGLPAGISGLLIGLYSAGIDSAVASYLMGKRGASVELVHFHALPAAAEAHRSKAGRLAQLVAGYFPAIKIHYIPYHHFQVATMTLDRHQKQELVVFRRFMAQAAERIAREHGALGLFSGDNLGQVASQTLENLSAVDAAVNSSIYRPLIAYDKQEIIDLGIELGFYDAANEDYKDCCSIVARHPTTKANLEQVEYIEEQIGMERVIERSLAELQTYEYRAVDQSVHTREIPSPLAS